jgi:hypothetical protein
MTKHELEAEYIIEKLAGRLPPVVEITYQDGFSETIIAATIIGAGRYQCNYDCSVRTLFLKEQTFDEWKASKEQE